MTRATGAQVELLESLAHEYPRRPGEGAIHYAERLAVMAGVLRREDAMLLDPDEDPKRRASSDERKARLPYKDD